MNPTQIRLDARTKKALDRLAKRERITRSDAMRQVLNEGLRTLLLRQSVQGYVEKRMSIGAAAQHASVTIAEMATHLASLGIPFYRYSAEELERDIDRAKGWLS